MMFGNRAVKRSHVTTTQNYVSVYRALQ